MRKFLPVGVSALLFLCAAVSQSDAQEKEPLRLVQTIPMPNVKGRIDHMDVDVKGKRLFVAGLENGSLEVVDLGAGKWSKSIPGFKKTQGVAYIPSLNKVFVAVCDRSGSERGLQFEAGSAIAGPDGVLRAAPASNRGERILTAVCDLAQAADKRTGEHNDAFADRRPAQYAGLSDP